MRNPTKDKFWGWRMYPFEVYAYWGFMENQPQFDIDIDIEG